jgi:hypothetical protein
MSEPSENRLSYPPPPPKYVDVFLYAAAAISYIGLSMYHKWLLDWIVGPLWLVAWVWGLPAIVRLVRGQPVRPQRGPVPPGQDPGQER